jgi:hypothetical protein
MPPYHTRAERVTAAPRPSLGHRQHQPLRHTLQLDSRDMPLWLITPQHLLPQSPLRIARRPRRRLMPTMGQDLDQLLRTITMPRSTITPCRRPLHHNQHQVLISLAHLLEVKDSAVLRTQLYNAQTRLGLSRGRRRAHHPSLHPRLLLRQASLMARRLHPASSEHPPCPPSSTQTILGHRASHQLLSHRLPMHLYLHLASLRNSISQWPPHPLVDMASSSMAALLDRCRGPIPIA